MKADYEQPEEIVKFIESKGYEKDRQFNNRASTLKRLVQYINDMEPSLKSLKIVQRLMKFYTFPIFICFRPLYEKLQKMEDFQGEEEVRDLAAFVRQYLDNQKLEELKFFFYLGTSKKKYKIKEKSKIQIEFTDYIKKLSKSLLELKKNADQMNSKILKSQIDKILSAGMERSLNFIETQYENYFKREANEIYMKHRDKIDEENEQFQPTNKGIEMKPQLTEEKPDPMCCRQFFYDGQSIKQPENLVLQYKNYIFPFDERRVFILKKTICAFLNTNGGIIFVGIHEHVDTKKRTVRGLYLSQAEKQNFLVSIRKIAQKIEPQIISNKLYEVKFVPIKSSYPPFNYISGKFLAKIIVKYGQRDDVYSYDDKNADLFSFRTENEVIHRQGREILNILRQRIKHPLPIPDPVHQGPCKVPNEGRGIYKPVYENKYKNNSRRKEPTKYKEKDAVDFLLVGISEIDLLEQLQQKDLKKQVQVIHKSKLICFLKILDEKKKEQMIVFLTQVQSLMNIDVLQVQRGIRLVEMEGYQPDIIKSALKNPKHELQKINYEYIDSEDTFKFRYAAEAIEAYLRIYELKFKTEFVSI